MARLRGSDSDGHVAGVSILHLGFLGTRHTALVSADVKGMAFSHIASRGMGMVARSVHTTRILGRYPDTAPSLKPKRPSSVLAFASLPLGSAEHSTDSMGIVAMLTPYLLVIVSTTPVAQTQHKSARPKELAAHGAMSAALAWYPAVQVKDGDQLVSDKSSTIKLAYCWSDVLMILEVSEIEVSDGPGKDKPPDLLFQVRKRWKAEEAIVAVQWLSRSVLGVMTITQQLLILEDTSLKVTDSSDLIRRHIYHIDLFSQQLSQLIEKLDEEDTSMHGVVADAFYMSFRAYKGRLFMLGFNDVSVGSMSNWADRLLALMEQGNFIGAIRLATSYYNGETDKATVGLPENDSSRHNVVRDKLVEMMSASLRYAFGKNQEAGIRRVSENQLVELATACTLACISLEDIDFLFEDLYAWYEDGELQRIILETLEAYILDGEITVIPPSVIKDLINHFVQQGWNSRLEEILCRLNPETLDIDQVTTLCRQNYLYDALLYVWNQALRDYTTILKELLDFGSTSQVDSPGTRAGKMEAAQKVFPYLSYILTSRVYPIGIQLSEEQAVIAKADIYNFLFSGDRGKTINGTSDKNPPGSTFPNLESILDLDAPSFLSMLNEAFEDSFLNGPLESLGIDEVSLTDAQRFGLTLNRQLIISILFEIMIPPRYSPEEIVYMDMFVARNLPKFPQYILLSGSILHRVLVDLCNYSSAEIADDCQLSVEYLLSVYQPPDLLSLIPLLKQAHFYRVMKSIYTAEKQYPLLLRTCFEDDEDPGSVFDCIRDCLRPGSGLNDGQMESVRNIIVQNAKRLVSVNLGKAAATIQQYAPELHTVILSVLEGDEHSQYQYLRNILEPQSTPTSDGNLATSSSNNRFVEQYVRLLCDYDREHVRDYVETLKAGDLRLEAVVPALESSGAIDAAVILMAREGKVREASDRVTQYLGTLEAALRGLLDAAIDAPDLANTQEAADDLVESIDKYTRVGIWLCHGQSKTTSQPNTSAKRPRSNRKKSMEEELSLDENLWLNLIDAIVQITRNVSAVLESRSITGIPSEPQRRSIMHVFDSSKLLTSLRTTIQDTFTALLGATSMPSTGDPHRRNMAFLRILRAFLNRASESSPSLSNLRTVLSAIFSAYSYEESLLDLANRLLDKDVFVHVQEVTALRKRGWRPLGQVCEGCGQRVWGPGAGSVIWDAWAESQDQTKQVGELAEDTAPPPENGKGKAAAREPEADRTGLVAPDRSGKGRTEEGNAGDKTLIIFSCRHIFHRRCLEEMRMTGKGVSEGQNLVSEYSCPLCT